MRSNLLYVTMIMILAASGVYLVRQSQGAPQRAIQAARFTPRYPNHPPLLNEPMVEVLAQFAARFEAGSREPAEIATADMVATDFTSVALGYTKHEVESELGEPVFRSVDDDRWSYGNRVIVFHDDRVAGWVALNEQGIELHRRAVALGLKGVDRPVVQMAGRFADAAKAPTNRRPGREYTPTFGIRDRLFEQRTGSRFVFQRPDFMRAFTQTLNRNDSRHRQNRSSHPSIVSRR